MQLRSFRRQIALALLFLSPGIGGSAMSLLHPCPVEEGKTALLRAAGQASEAATAHAGHHAPSDTPSDDCGCTCLGSCHTPAVCSTPAAQIALQPLRLTPSGDGLQHARRTFPALLPQHRLPPSTAPPRA